MKTPAEQLEGRTLDGGWNVLQPVTVSVGQTRGCFSHGHIVEANDGRRAFLKTLDFERAKRAPDPGPRAPGTHRGIQLRA
jgi:hypothetical protein